MSAEMIGRLVDGGISLLVAVFMLLVGTGIVKPIKDPDKAETLEKFRWVFLIGGVLGILVACVKILS